MGIKSKYSGTDKEATQNRYESFAGAAEGFASNFVQGKGANDISGWETEYNAYEFCFNINGGNTINLNSDGEYVLIDPRFLAGEKSANECEFYSLVNHEMAHACHFSKVGKDWWDAYIMYIAENYLAGRDVYGDASQENSGICAVGEMWAYYLESKMYKARYGGSNPAFGSTYWFHPQILTSIEDRGISTSDILSAYDAGITGKNALRDRLVELFPSKRNSILQIFNRYD